MMNLCKRRVATAFWVFTACSARRAFASAPHQRSYRTVQVQVIHRHGDRTPITPMKNEEYWEGQLLTKEKLEKIAMGTKIVRDGDSGYSHLAGGRGVFGKLTELGLLQMIRVGLNLKEELVCSEKNQDNNSNNENLFYSPLFGGDNGQHSLTSESVSVFSTNFPRTIQSVQGLLMGLMDNEDEDNISNHQTDPVEIDVRHTSTMIPDPQPRETKEQELLEAMAMAQPHMLEQEAEHLDLAIRATEAIHPLLGAGAHEVAFGVVQEHPEHMSIETEPLAWNQLAEISKCLLVRSQLPEQLSEQDVEAISSHTAWRWFETFTHPRLIFLAMHKLLAKQLGYMEDHLNHPPLTIFSAHDSTLIALLSAYRLERPSVWPEYASLLAIELVEITTNDNRNEKELAVRFSLNGERLQSLWDPANPLEMVPLSLLKEKTSTVGSQPSNFAEQQ